MTAKQLINVLVHAGHLLKLNLKEIADITGHSPSVISRWHNKSKAPDLYQFVDWANSLGYEVKLVRPVTAVRTKEPLDPARDTS